MAGFLRLEQPLPSALLAIAAAWAEENTRESLYSAFRRKEVYATSGPRMQIRLFAGYGFDESLLTQADGIERAYATGVTMGGNLGPYAATEGEQSIQPGFLVMASADTQSAPLQRLQIVKGWVDADGTHEEVVDVACAGGAAVNPKTSRCPDNGAKVDVSDCSSTKKPAQRNSPRYGEILTLKQMSERFTMRV